MKKVLLTALLLAPLVAYPARKFSSILNYNMSNPGGCYLGNGLASVTLSNPSSITQTARVAFKFNSSNLVGASCYLQTRYILSPTNTPFLFTNGSTCTRNTTTTEISCPAINVPIPAGNSLYVDIANFSCLGGSLIQGAGSAIGIEIAEDNGFLVGSASTVCHGDATGADIGQIAQTALAGGHAF